MAAPAEVTKARCTAKYIDYTGKSNNGMNFKVINYEDTKNITVQFEDGTIVTTNVHHVLTNSVPHPTYTARMYKRDCHIGEKGMSASGLEMTIIAFRTYADIDVQFPDGAIVKNKNYGSFKKGEIKHPDGTGKGVIPSQRIGMKVKQTNGQIAEIIDYKNQLDITIRFEDGTIITDKPYKSFINGCVRNPNISGYGTTLKTNRVGETNTSLDGQIMTIIEYTNSHHMKIKFDDGETMSTDYQRFKEGKIRSPKWFKNKYEGLHFIASNGIPVTILKAEDCNNLTAEFETGYTRTVTTGGVTSKKIKHPFPYDVGERTILSVAYNFGDECNYEYVCCKCGCTDIGNIDEIRNHICDENLTTNEKGEY